MKVQEGLKGALLGVFVFILAMLIPGTLFGCIFLGLHTSIQEALLLSLTLGLGIDVVVILCAVGVDHLGDLWS